MYFRLIERIRRQCKLIIICRVPEVNKSYKKIQLEKEAAILDREMQSLKKENMELKSSQSINLEKHEIYIKFEKDFEELKEAETKNIEFIKRL